MLGISELRHRIAVLEAQAAKANYQAELTAKLLIDTATLLNANSTTTNTNFTNVVESINRLCEAVSRLQRAVDDDRSDDWWRRGRGDDATSDPELPST